MHLKKAIKVEKQNKLQEQFMILLLLCINIIINSYTIFHLVELLWIWLPQV